MNERKAPKFTPEQQAYIEQIIDKRFGKIMQRNERRITELSRGYEAEIWNLERQIMEQN